MGKSERGYENSEKRTHCLGLLRIFKGQPKPENAPRYRDGKVKIYHHTPTHAASSFMKTATTPAMVPAMQAQAEKKQGEGINAVEADGLLQPAPQSVKTA